MGDRLYNTNRWKVARARAIERDHGRCVVARLLGGACSTGSPHVHHLRRPEDGGRPYAVENLATVCRRHHPQWEAVRRAVLSRRDRERIRCPHRHVNLSARLLGEARLARRRVAA